MRQVLPQVFRLARHLRPTLHLAGVDMIDEALLQAQRIDAIIWDVDGTLVPPANHEGTEALQPIFRALRVRHAIVSNGPDARLKALGRALPDIPIITGYAASGTAVYRILHHGTEQWLHGTDSIDPRPGLPALRKPDPALIHFTVAWLGCTRDRVVMVGDQYFTDIAGANLAGIRSIKVPTLGRAYFPGPVRWFQRVESLLYRVLYGP